MKWAYPMTSDCVNARNDASSFFNKSFWGLAWKRQAIMLLEPNALMTSNILC